MDNRFIDLSHTIEDGMPGFKMKNEDGTVTQYTARVRPFLTHEQSKPKYQGKCSFEITELQLQTSVGTYLDSPYHRYPDGRDISQIKIEEVILPGVVVDARGRETFEALGLDALPARLSLRGRAVLFNFGWDAYWGQDKYHAYPYLAQEVIDHLIDAGVRLVGVDTINIDDSRNLERPAHTLFLKSEIFIVENLCSLDALHGRDFTFFAVPLKVKTAAAMPVRAFAGIE